MVLSSCEIFVRLYFFYNKTFGLSIHQNVDYDMCIFLNRTSFISFHTYINNDTKMANDSKVFGIITAQLLKPEVGFFNVHSRIRTYILLSHTYYHPDIAIYIYSCFLRWPRNLMHLSWIRRCCSCAQRNSFGIERIRPKLEMVSNLTAPREHRCSYASACLVGHALVSSWARASPFVRWMVRGELVMMSSYAR